MNILINLNKSPEWTSHDAVAAVKKIFKVRKAGHAGTLDPLATGVLLVCLNEATKVTGFLSDLDKEYRMTAKLGESTDTYDAEGTVIQRVDRVDIAEEDIRSVLPQFLGTIEQIPPMYSAIKVSGKPLYTLARKGIEVERKPRRVTISSIEILSYAQPFLTLRVSCSKGTYIRSLCNDIGNALGVGAHITQLIRTRVGPFCIEHAATIEELPGKAESLYSMDTGLQHLPALFLEGTALKRAKNGNPISYGQEVKREQEGGKEVFVRLKDPDGTLFGIGRIGKGSIKVERLFNVK